MYTIYVPLFLIAFIALAPTSPSLHEKVIRHLYIRIGQVPCNNAWQAGRAKPAGPSSIAVKTEESLGMPRAHVDRASVVISYTKAPLVISAPLAR
jgi:hypothetical protein